MQSSIEKNLNENSRENDEMINSGLKKRLLFDGENYYLVRSLNRNDIENFDRSNGIVPKIDSDSAYTVSDVIAQVRMQHRKTNLISMSEDPNIVLTYDKSNLHRFVLVKLSKNEIEDSKKVFSAGEYLLGVMDSQIESQTQNASSIVKQVLDNVDSASSVEEIIKIINDVINKGTAKAIKNMYKKSPIHNCIRLIFFEWRARQESNPQPPGS